MFVSLLCVGDKSTGVSPLHIAAKNGRAEFLKIIITTVSTHTTFDAQDVKGNTIYHYAAQSNKETIEVSRYITDEFFLSCSTSLFYFRFWVFVHLMV